MPDGKFSNFAFKNNGDYTFDNVSAEWGLNYNGYSNGSTYSDLDNTKNVVKGNDVKLYNAKENIIYVPDGKLVVIQGLNGYIVVENEDALLICKKEDEQQIKQFVQDLKLTGRSDKI